MDNHHVNISSSSMSCGVLELSRIESDMNKVLYAIATFLYHPARGNPAAVITWSDVQDSHGAILHRILDNWKSFGQVYTTPWVENPKTGNQIQVFTWVVVHENFKKWYLDERIERAKKL